MSVCVCVWLCQRASYASSLRPTHVSSCTRGSARPPGVARLMYHPQGSIAALTGENRTRWAEVRETHFSEVRSAGYPCCPLCCFPPPPHTHTYALTHHTHAHTRTTRTTR